MRKIIGVSGLARSGKDTAAVIMVEEYGYTRVAFGDKLKEAAYAMDPLVIVNDTVTRLQKVVDQFGWDQAKSHPEIRRTLQRMGSDAGWKIHGEKLWVDALENTVNEMNVDANIVIPDVRFRHEAEWIIQNGGRIITVIRPDNNLSLSGDLSAHDSEQGLGESIPVDIIYNDSSRDSFQNKIREYLIRNDI